MIEYYCYECNYCGFEEVCPHCGLPAEPIKYPDDAMSDGSQNTNNYSQSNQTYPKELMNEYADGEPDELSKDVDQKAQYRMDLNIDHEQ